jgi:hypothetical protein
MSISQRALILIRLDARSGEGPITVADLAAHMNLAEDVVRLRIEELWQEGYVLPWRESPCPESLGTIVAVSLNGRLPKCA